MSPQKNEARMQTLAEIKAFLAEHGLNPKKSLGQNFLIDQNLVRKLADAAEGMSPQRLMLEVGPGTGVLTQELLARGCRVVACELDDALAALLAERGPAWPGGEGLRVVHADCLKSQRELSEPLAAAMREEGMIDGTPAARPYTLGANLPYGAATPLMITLLLHHPACVGMAVTIQREVADRLLARPATKDYGALAVVAQALAEVSRLATAPPECFWPRPDVTSAMVVLRRREAPLTADPHDLSEFCRVIFAQRRKQLGAVLKGAGVRALPEGFSPTGRAEELGVEAIEALRVATLDQRRGR